MNRAPGFVLVLSLLPGALPVNVSGNSLDLSDGDCVRGWVTERANAAEAASPRCSCNPDRSVMGLEGERQSQPSAGRGGQGGTFVLFGNLDSRLMGGPGSSCQRGARAALRTLGGGSRTGAEKGLRLQGQGPTSRWAHRMPGSSKLVAAPLLPWQQRLLPIPDVYLLLRPGSCRPSSNPVSSTLAVGVLAKSLSL